MEQSRIFLISNKFYWYQKRDTLAHGQQIKNKNYKNQENQERKRMIGFAK